jgi:hypothetical protein
MRLLFELIAIWGLIAMAFVFGRIWEIRRELRKRSQRLDNKADFMIPTAQIPNVVNPRTANAIF